MNNYIDTTSEEYKQEGETNTLQIESEETKTDLKVEDTLYGVNKPTRKIIRATISHG